MTRIIFAISISMITFSAHSEMLTDPPSTVEQEAVSEMDCPNKDPDQCRPPQQPKPCQFAGCQRKFVEASGSERRSAHPSDHARFESTGSADSWTFEYPIETRRDAAYHADLSADSFCGIKAIRIGAYSFHEECRLKRYGAEYFDYCVSSAKALYRCP